MLLSKLVLDFLFPRTCVRCKAPLSSSETFLCSQCFSELVPADSSLLASEYFGKFGSEKIVNDFFALFVFEKDTAIQSLIHALKYEFKFKVGLYLGEQIGERGRDKINSWRADFIVPIPLHRVKKAERGYNQSFYLAKGVSKVSGIKVSSRILRRKKFTISQTQLSRTERQANVLNAFEVKARHLEGKRIILIDDVITTGSTVSEAARVLKNAGATEVFALSVCTA
jgi:ComF family protein